MICPDLVGRGQSGWLAQPAGYTLLQYGADMNALLARLDVEEVDWIGNSLGGLIAMMLAAQPGEPDPPAGAQRYRPVHPRHGPAPARRLPQRPAAAVRRPRRGRALYPHHAGPVRRADRRSLAPPRRAQRAPRRQWRPPAPPRPRHRRGLPPLAPGQHPDVGSLGQGPLPGPAAARCRIRPAARRPPPRR